MKMRPSSTGEKADELSKQPRGRISLDQFYSFVKDLELMDLASTAASDEKHMKSGYDVNDSDILRLMENAEKLTEQLVDTERNLLDLMAVAGWDPSKLGLVNNDSSTSLYLLYQFTPSESITSQNTTENGNTFDLEVIQPPPKQSPRLEVLKDVYKFSLKIYCGHGTLDATKRWWIHVANVAQVILDSRKQSISKNSAMNAKKKGKNPLASITAGLTASELITKDMTLEERVRIRARIREQSLLNQSGSLKARSPGSSSDPQHRKNRTLLELADSLWSFANRRSLGDRSGFLCEGSKKELSNIAFVDNGKSGKNARLAVVDFIKDARISWKSVVGRGNFGGVNGESNSNAGSGGRYSSLGVKDVANIDLSRVLFHIRMKMVSTTDGSEFSLNVTSDTRRMETEILGLLEELASMFPEWVRLLDAPSSLTAANKFGGAWEYSRVGNNGITNKKPSARRSIILIRNYAVDYASYVHSKLGARNSQVEPTKQSQTVDMMRFRSSACSKKRSYNEVHHNDKKDGPSAIADTIVPPSFVRLYGKALGIIENNAKG